MTRTTSMQKLMDLGFYNDSLHGASAMPENETNTDYVYTITACIFLLISTALLIILNPLCLLALRHVNTVYDTTKVFLRSMTAADLGLGIFAAAPMTVSTFCGTWPFGDAMCGLQSFLYISFITSSLLSLLLLSADRYISVVYALRYHALVTVKRAWIAACAAWVIGLCIATGAGILTSWETIYSKGALACTFYKPGTDVLIYLQVTFASTVLSSLLALLTVHCRLSLISRHHARRIHADNQLAEQGNQPARPKHRALNTLFLVALSALFLNLLPVLFLFLSHNPSYKVTTFFLTLLPCLTNSWVNVVIYYFRNTEIRKATKQLLLSYYHFCKRGNPFNTQ